MRDSDLVRGRRTGCSALFCGVLLAVIQAGPSAAPAAQNSAPVTQPTMAPADSCPGIIEGRVVEIRPEADGTVRDVHCHEGQSVKRGDVLIQLDDSVAQAQVDAAKAEYMLADDRARNLENAPKGTFSQTERNIVMAQRQVAASTLVIRLAALQATRLVAPLDGVILRCDAVPGEVAARGISLITIIQVKPSRVRFSVPKLGYEQTRLGKEAGVYDSVTRKLLAAAKVSFISPEFDPSTGTATIKADLEDSDAKLKPGMSVIVGFKD